MTKITEEKERCKHRVYGQYDQLRGHQCLKNVWKDGVCKTHHPETIDARQKQAMAQYNIKYQNSAPVQLGKALARIKELETVIAELKSKIKEIESNAA